MTKERFQEIGRALNVPEDFIDESWERRPAWLTAEKVDPFEEPAVTGLFIGFLVLMREEKLQEATNN